ncbi:DUF72 domain-containing protein [Modestobacter sp. VKM Ac-2979]|uniref:DUF72 domain-containing protein n=1 Tax=unclassified Modestobacter TaxID=2643866 RepID=UPI0022ABB7AA|nr:MULTISPECIES: DUF72 domain-containing protein [unclassified Modestobacter]MCZ2810614.1 DUF72 domain-containing protein [Modestobacter sp. VKM Ac-2979]MCZ2842100.1 DUF72 domain-containing protein [Modestobacter sp. VKM Ac-2980]
MTVVIGTSGWQYRDWRGRFYPPVLPQRLWLEHHAEHFATVESNNAFYRLPEKATFERWRDRTPPDYRWAVKASRFLTHLKRLREPAEPVARLMDRVAGLGDRLDVVLLQLPPTLKADVELLSECLGQFPAGTRVAVEPRHESWWTDEVRGLLERYQAALCWADRAEQPIAPLWRTAEWGYLRLHTGADGWGYRPETLQLWAQRLAETYGDDDVLVYFNNDPGGAATVDAVTFADAVRATGGTHTRVPTMAQASGAAWPPKPPPKAPRTPSRQRAAGSSAKVTPS